MNISAQTIKLIRTSLITAAVILLPFSIYYYGFRTQQQVYHNQRYARQLDMVARQFRDSVIYMQKLALFKQQERASEEWAGVLRTRDVLRRLELSHAAKEHELEEVETELKEVREAISNHSHEKEKYLASRFEGRLNPSRLELEAAEEPFKHILDGLGDREDKLQEDQEDLTNDLEQVKNARRSHDTAVAALDEALGIGEDGVESNAPTCPSHLAACRKASPFERLDIDVVAGSRCDGRGVFEISRHGHEVELVASYGEGAGNTCTARIPLVDIAFQGDAQRFFDAVLLVGPDTKVLAQNDSQLPGITSVDAKLNDSSIGPSQKASDQAANQSVTASVDGLSALLARGERPTRDIAGVTYRVFPQSVRLPLGSKLPDEGATADAEAEAGGGPASDMPSWTFFGLVSEQTYAGQIGVPLDFLALAMLAVILAVLAWPFLRLRLMGPNESIQRSDLAFLVVATLLGVACVTAAVLDLVQTRTHRDRTDRVLAEISRTMTRSFEQELAESLRLLESSSEEYAADASRDSRTPTMEQRLPEPGAPMTPPFNTMFWLGADGIQVGPQVTYRVVPARGQLKLGQRQYFRRILEGKTWSFEREGSLSDERFPPFFVDRIVSWKEGSKETAISIDMGFARSGEEPDGAVVAVMLKPIETFRRAIFGQGMGFAVIDEEGLVLYHSDDSLSLSENFLVEAHPHRPIASAVATEVGRAVIGQYHGDPHRLHVAPLPHVPWTLVVFYDERFIQAAHFGQTVAFTSALFAVALVGLLLVAVVQRFFGKGSPPRWIWPDPNLEHSYWIAAAYLGLLAAAGLTLSVQRIPPSAPPASSTWWMLLTLFLLVVQGWLVCAEVFDRSGRVLEEGRRVRVRRLAPCLVLFAGAAWLIFDQQVTGTRAKVLALALLAAAGAVGFVLVERSTRTERPDRQQPVPLRAAHATMLISGTILTAVPLAILLLWDVSQVQVNRLVNANTASVAVAISEKAEELIEAAERYCYMKIGKGGLGAGSKARNCATQADRIRGAAGGETGARWAEYRPDRVVLDLWGLSPPAESPKPPLWIESAQKVISLSLLAYSGSPVEELDGLEPGAPGWVELAAAESPADPAEEATDWREVLWRDRISGFLATSVPPFDAASAEMDGYVAPHSTSTRWRVTHSGKPSDEQAQVSLVYCSEGEGACFKITRKIKQSWLPDDGFDRALLGLLAIAGFLSMRWVVLYGRRRLVGEGQERPEPRLPMTWLISGAWSVAEPALRAALADEKLRELSFTDATDETKAAERLYFADLHHKVLVIQDFDRLVLEEPGVRDALLRFLESRLTRSGTSYARSVVLVTNKSRADIVAGLSSQLGSKNVKRWERVLDRCTEATRTANLQLWICGSDNGGLAEVNQWLGWVGAGEQKQSLTHGRFGDNPIRDFGGRELVVVSDLDSILEHEDERETLRILLERYAEENAAHDEPGQKPHTVFLLSRQNREALLEKLQSDDVDLEQWSRLFGEIAEVQDPRSTARAAEHDSDEIARLLERERSWNPELAATLHKAEQWAGEAHPRPNSPEVATHISELAESRYRDTWNACSNDEKLALFHLAHGRMLNPANVSVIDSLIGSRLVRKAPHLQIASPSFERFVQGAASPEEVVAWHKKHTSTWQDLRVPLAVVLLAGAALVVFAGGESTVALVSGLAAAIPAIVQLIGRVLPGRGGGGL